MQLKEIWSSILKTWLDIWPWVVGALIAMIVFFWLSDTALGTKERHQGIVQGRLYVPAWVEPGYSTNSCDSKGHCETSFHPPIYHSEEFRVQLALDTRNDGTRNYQVWRSLYMKVDSGSVVQLSCRRGFLSHHLYCVPHN